jgi:hypothetical protein
MFSQCALLNDIIHFSLLLENLKETAHMEDIGIDGQIMLK